MVLSTAVKHPGSRVRRRCWEALFLEVVKLQPIKKMIGSGQTSDNT